MKTPDQVANEAANVVLDREAVSLVGLQDALRGETRLAPEGEPAGAWLREVAKMARIVAAVEHWTRTYGAALKPPGADTYGEGMRDAKDQVLRILRGEIADFEINQAIGRIYEMLSLRLAAGKCLASHEDIGCSCDGCRALRNALTETSK